MPSRRSVITGIGVVAAGGVGWLTVDPGGELTPENPAYDLDGDGLFEDINGDGQFNYTDVLAYSHEGIWEETTGEDFGHAFDYAGDGGWAGNIATLTDYALVNQHEGMWDYSGNRFEVTFYRLPDFPQERAEQAAHHAETALNNGAIRTGKDRYADIPVNEIDLQRTGLRQDYESADTLVNDAEQFFSTGQNQDADEYGVLLYPHGDPAAYAPDDGEWAIITGMTQLPDHDGTPLFTRDRTTVLPSRGAGLALGMDEHRLSASVQMDELTGDIFAVFGPMDTYTLAEYRKDIAALENGSAGTVPENARLVKKASYVTVFFDPAFDNAIEDLG